jgi:hypothetical protein
MKISVNLEMEVTQVEKHTYEETTGWVFKERERARGHVASKEGGEKDI